MKKVLILIAITILVTACAWWFNETKGLGSFDIIARPGLTYDSPEVWDKISQVLKLDPSQQERSFTVSITIQQEAYPFRMATINRTFCEGWAREVIPYDGFDNPVEIPTGKYWILSAMIYRDGGCQQEDLCYKYLQKTLTSEVNCGE